MESGVDFFMHERLHKNSKLIILALVSGGYYTQRRMADCVLTVSGMCYNITHRQGSQTVCIKQFCISLVTSYTMKSMEQGYL